MIADFFVIFFNKASLCLMVLFHALTNSYPSAFAEQQMSNIVKPVFQITYKSRGSIRNFEGSIDVDLFKSSQVDHLFCRVMLPALSGFWPETPLLFGTLVKPCEMYGYQYGISYFGLCTKRIV